MKEMGERQRGSESDSSNVLSEIRGVATVTVSSMCSSNLTASLTRGAPKLKSLALSPKEGDLHICMYECMHVRRRPLYSTQRQVDE